MEWETTSLKCGREYGNRTIFFCLKTCYNIKQRQVQETNKSILRLQNYIFKKAF